MRQCMRGAPFSLVIPFFNEAESLGQLLAEVDRLATSGLSVEAIAVDDGSTDRTPALLADARRQYAWLRIVTHGHNRGQSAALLSGVRHARHERIVTLDGDGQNKPEDALRLLDHLDDTSPFLLIAGWRRHRHDSWLRKLSSHVANRVRAFFLADQCPDTGCGLKAFRRDDFLLLPTFDHMHRFLPALFQAAGGEVCNVEVEHRPRRAGQSKYGVNNRLWVGLVDLLAVRWLLKRHRQLALPSDGNSS